MIRSSAFRLMLVAMLVFSWMALPSFNLCIAQTENEQRSVLPLSPAPAAGVTVRKVVSSTLHWEQREYPASEGIQVLMRAVTDPHTNLNKRIKALEKLGTLGSRLHKTDRVPELIALYDTFRDREEKIRLIGCLAASEDKRALPLFARFLSEAKDDVARFVGAYALAHWNIRRGISELINLLESRELGPEGQSFATEVLKTFQGLNLRKGWGLPEQEILRRVMSRSDLNQHQKIALHIVEIKNWFEVNKHRFPDWKPGDPLPVVEASTDKRK